ncbi:MAG TPA: hypothetical protein VHW60_17835 [Caulobacteraceae bacterium]|jgi:outer membrane PBP1 activator LpoA protein|nr:hypothetical protein [Caulobacteraceae bacterium]
MIARQLLPMLAAPALAACTQTPAAQPVQGQVQPQPQAQSQALVGRWSTAVNWNLPSWLMIITTFGPDGRSTTYLRTNATGFPTQ